MLENFLLLLAVSGAWALGYLFIGAADQGLPPVTEAAAMTLIAAAAMIPIVGLTKRRRLLEPLRRRPWVPVVMAFTAIALPNLAVVAAEEKVSPELAAVLGTTVPILTLLLNTFVTRRTRFSVERMLGAAVALAGLVVFVGWRHVLGDSAELYGIGVMVSGGLVFTLNGLWVSHQTRDLDGAALATWTIAMGGLALAGAAFAWEDPLALAWTPALLRDLVAEGILGIGFAYLAYYVLVARAGATFASFYAFLVPPLGLVASALLLGDRVTSDHLVGMATLIVGLVLLTRTGEHLSPRRRSEEPAAEDRERAAPERRPDPAP